MPCELRNDPLTSFNTVDECVDDSMLSFHISLVVFKLRYVCSLK